MLKWNNEEWIVRNVPLNAKLSISIYDKNDEKVVDDYIGEFEIPNIINYHAPPGGHVIADSGRFHLSIHSTKSSNESQLLPHYTFDGPCRYSRHDSLPVGHLSMSNADCIYSTWKIQLRRISFFFPPNEQQQWSRQYKPARQLFGNYPTSLAAQSNMKLAHKELYGRTVKDHEEGRLTSTDDLWKLIFLDRVTQKIKPRIYTYIIDDNTWQFSETGHRFFGDSTRKHAVLTNCSECVHYAGEFHLRPKFGWNRLDDEWELVFDNASGTYSPNADLLVNLKKLILFNFPGLNVVTYDYKDPMLQESIEQMEMYAEKYNRSTTTTRMKWITT
jgi:hypothetical protein